MRTPCHLITAGNWSRTHRPHGIQNRERWRWPGGDHRPLRRFYYVGYVSRRRTTSDTDLFAAGFSIGPITNGLAMAATWASLATFLGVIALIVNEQVPFVYLWIQWVLSIPLLTLLYGTSLRRIKSFTPASFIRLRYGNGSAIVIIGWMCLTMVMYALGQMVGLGQAF